MPMPSSTALSSRLADFRAETPWIWRVILIEILTLLASEYTRRVVKPRSLALREMQTSQQRQQHQRRGRQRRQQQKHQRGGSTFSTAASVASVVPLLVFLLLAPLAFDPITEITSRSMSVFIHVCLAAFKVAGLLLGRGPLAAREWSPAQFAFVFAVPVNPVIEAEGGGGDGDGGDVGGDVGGGVEEPSGGGGKREVKGKVKSDGGGDVGGSSSSSNGRSSNGRSTKPSSSSSRSRSRSRSRTTAAKEEQLDEGGALERAAVAAATLALAALVVRELRAAATKGAAAFATLPAWLVLYIYVWLLYFSREGQGKGESGNGSSSRNSGVGAKRPSSRSRTGEEVGGSALERVAFVGVKIAFIVYFVWGLKVEKASPGTFPGWLVPYAYVGMLYTLLGLTMDAVGALSGSLVGLKLSPHFDRPYMSTSFADLWGRRWNLVAGDAMRFLVFDVVCEGRLVKERRRPPSKGGGGDTPRAAPPRVSPARKVLAVVATFAVCGLVHELELIYVYPGLSRYTGYWMLYFTGWAVILTTEKVLKTAARKALSSASTSPPSSFKKFLLSPPRLLVTPFVTASTVAYSMLLFVAPPVELGISERFVESSASTVKSLFGIDI